MDGIRSKRIGSAMRSRKRCPWWSPAWCSPRSCEAARLYRICRSKGVTIASTVDCLIAQMAIRHGLELLTRDRIFLAISQVAPLRLMRNPAH